LTQLAWWHKEIEQATEQGSQHPVVQALLETGAISLLRGEDWRDYFHAIGDWLADAVLPNCEALRVRLRDTAGREARIMTAGCKEPDAECVRLLSLVARLAPGRATPSWVPLDLVARYGAEPGPTGVAGLARDLAELGLEGSHALAQTGPVEESVRLLRLTAALSGRLLERLRDEPEARLARGADRLGPIEVFSAWRWARRWPGVGA
jgi:hypothetical protein